MAGRQPLFEPPRKKTPARLNSLAWVFEPLEDEPGYARRKMFGCDAAYLDGLLCLVVADRAEPWNGLLVCTSQAHHASLMAQMPALRPHPELGKWLYLPQGHEDFESLAAAIVRGVRGRDERIGVPPRPRRARKTA
ncbi:hypothetical protein [Bordetella hinzii]|uniref:Uncharacterized protein n=2 Tax=Bordetella hinzii TaxID=103855 RepID=A0AAN1RXK6_9BORD|nr:hypothetical protein [Bordetella hinzii]AKQ56864.1 hypothetical protein ACR54_03574 [Bordetella hinzii]AKQ61331.1 hypothetical protein ACR55_03487 [Bordetella hinzii]AZW17690.1 hypothetical protein CS347_13390 [Bordetella hinzii]KCB23837.1 hypothetical protein L544_3764 [Bordetella hinzii OH87 BAL007II]KCB33920.1 hypothetical protein L541_1381 [Bordetella hinzii CA90 BAL1384]